MKKKQGFALRRLAGEAIIVGQSLERIDFDRLVTLNPSAACVWEALGENDRFDAAAVARVLTDRYEVDAAVALKDAGELLDGWLEAGIVEP